MQVDFPSVIDSTMLADYRACGMKFNRAHLEDWKPRGHSIHLHAGAAFAKGLEVARKEFYVSHASPEDAVASGVAALILAYGDYDAGGHAKSLDRMAEALVFYFQQYPLDSDLVTPHVFPSGEHGIEFSFATPLPFAHPVTGLPLIYSGRADMVADYQGGVWVFDDKTATSLGQSWLNQWKLRSQFTSYAWAAREAGFPVQGVIVRGISILKTKYDTLQALEPRADYFIERWLGQTIRDLTRMEADWRAGIWNFNFDHACTEFGGCHFADSCGAQIPEEWLPVNFERRHWNPLARTETAL